MRKLITALAVPALGLVLFAGDAAAHEGGHGPCQGGAPSALPAGGFDVEPGPEFGPAIRGLATGETLGISAREVVELIHLTYCASNSAP